MTIESKSLEATLIEDQFNISVWFRHQWQWEIRFIMGVSNDSSEGIGLNSIRDNLN